MMRLTMCGLAMFLMTVPGASSRAQTPGTSGRTIQIDETLWLQLTDEPSHHMHEAHEEFRAKNKAEAIRNTRKVAVFLRIAAANTPADTRDVLENAADDLTAVANGIQDGTVVHAAVLEQSFARAEHALARHQYALAMESWSRKQTRIAGYRMRAAGNAMERGARWSGEELDAGTRTTVDTTRRLGGAMIEGTGFVVDEIGKGMKTLGTGITHLGERVKRKS